MEESELFLLNFDLEAEFLFSLLLLIVLLAFLSSITSLSLNPIFLSLLSHFLRYFSIYVNLSITKTS